MMKSASDVAAARFYRPGCEAECQRSLLSGSPSSSKASDRGSDASEKDSDSTSACRYMLIKSQLPASLAVR